MFQTHADYGSKSQPEGPYLVHRLLQAQQLASFIRLTSSSCDASFLAGDFNFQPHELGYRIVLHETQMKDAWLFQKVIFIYFIDKKFNIIHINILVD